MKKLFLIIGAPGSGKTTDAQIIAQNNPESMVHYSTGDLLRAEVASGSERGKLIDSFVSKGNLVPLEIVVETIVGAIENAPRENVIIDGYPRSVEQMEALDKVLSTRSDVEIASVVEVVVSEQVACDRVLGRARGDDDNVEAFIIRYDNFLNNTKVLVDYYNDKNKLHIVDVNRNINDIFNDISRIVAND